MNIRSLAHQVGPLSDGLGGSADIVADSPVADSRSRGHAMTHRERRSDLVVGVLFLTLAIAMAALVDWNRPLSWSALAAVTFCFAVASKVEFPIGVGWTNPTQLAFVPMLFLVPTALVPAVTGVALLLAFLPGLLRGRSHPDGVISVLANPWYSLAPAAVFIVAGVTSPNAADWWIYVLALGAQIAFDAVGMALRLRLCGRLATFSSMATGWSNVVDVLLSSAGLLGAFACADGKPLVILLILPLFAVIAIFARDRRARIEGGLELQNAYRGTAMLLGDFIEADHAYTGSHSRNVVELSVAVADALKLNPTQCRNVEFGALLHDIGKIAVPESIIEKAGPLNDAEWEIIKCHTIDGQRMLERVGGVLGAVGVVVRASHEHYDGRGYPDGLSGDDIPIEARIVSCCDAFSAMTTDRSYRSAMTHEAALLEVELHSGTQFDPRVAAALIESVRKQDALEVRARDRTPARV